MQKRKKVTIALITGVLAVAAIFGALTYQVAYAQTPTPTTPTQDATTPDTKDPGGLLPGPGRGHRGGPGGYTDDQLASALGITTEQLQAAYQTANTEALNEAVSQGLITQEQADQMAARMANGGRFFRFGKPGDASAIDYQALLADALNITTEQLQAAQQEATNASLDAAVQAGTLTQAQADEIKGMNALKNDSTFQAAMKAAFEAAVNQAVSSGVITQVQADAILQRQAQGGGFFGPGFGPGGHHGHGGPGFDGGPLTSPTPQSN